MTELDLKVPPAELVDVDRLQVDDACMHLGGKTTLVLLYDKFGKCISPIF